jgi:hypothetical protein
MAGSSACRSKWDKRTADNEASPKDGARRFGRIGEDVGG